ncbi:hypothetical protein [Haliea atlantica]
MDVMIYCHYTGLCDRPCSVGTGKAAPQASRRDSQHRWLPVVGHARKAGQAFNQGLIVAAPTAALSPAVLIALLAKELGAQGKLGQAAIVTTESVRVMLLATAAVATVADVEW